MLRTFKSVVGFPVVLLLIACGSSLVGSHFVKDQDVAAEQGATMDVTESDSQALAGTSVRIPPGALSSKVRVSVELGLGTILNPGDKAVSPVIILNPESAKLSQDASLVMPLTGVGASDQIDVMTDNAAGLTQVASDRVTISSSRRFATVKIRQFGAFQVRLHRAQADGGTSSRDGGTSRSDGGTIGADGGTGRSDGGTIGADGGTGRSDGGTTGTDGGVRSDGGR